MTEVTKPRQTYTVILRDASDTYKIYYVEATSQLGAASFCVRVWEAHGGTSPSIEFVFLGEVEPMIGVGAFYKGEKVLRLYEMDTDS
ncbi:hypothetical protein BAJUN_01200 [Bajunvirus bajun]|uniref:Uncharacterized protein n=1 Tax=Brevundimonas phage vB_BgoS-Bajun TaxID=2948594 RepID=A0A9E7SU37_9CAUD|nr:hypothetical protein BAJUN_01200 [Brevundimonas phage vB_BgoS-Bajun]